MPTAAYYTLGCKVNQYETEKIREKLESLGFSTVGFASLADVYVINSCTVTGIADAKSRHAVRQAIRRNPDAFIVATGCYAELSTDRIAEITGVDLVIGNDEKESIPERVAARFAAVDGYHPPQSPLDKGGRNSTPLPGKGEAHLTPLLGKEGLGEVDYQQKPRIRTRAFVKIQDGCNQFCAYCAVPYARKNVWSREIPDVLSELRTLAEFGYKEIVLTGIRLGSYMPGLPKLITAASEIEGIERIRLSSIEVWEIDDDLLQAMTASQKVCRHLHVPLQSGDADVLRMMKRPYTPEKYMDTVRIAKKAIPELGLTTDVIVGFPGESDESFERSYNLVEEIGFSRLHVFRYSPRPKTAAADMPDQVQESVKTQRSEKMIELGRDSMCRFARKLAGQKVSVLVQSKRTEFLSGITDNYVEVQFAGSSKLRGNIIEVKVDSITDEGICIGSREMRNAE